MNARVRYDGSDSLQGRTVRQLHRAVRDDLGDLQTRRPLPGARLQQIDPFLFLTHHGPQLFPANNRGLPFGPHPHRGFETVTFIIEGAVTHRDSGGHESVIHAGGVQWMTAGKGVIHAEQSPADFRQSGGPLEILQLWINLPSQLKMTEPAYTGLQRHEIPALPTADGKGRVNLIAGEWNGHNGPVKSLTGVFMATVELDPGARVRFDGTARRNVFLYVVRGALRIAGNEVPAHQLVELNDDGDVIEIEAAEDSVLLFGHGDPIGEPVVSHGPFVMNTAEEINQAVRDYHAGKFGKVAAA